MLVPILRKKALEPTMRIRQAVITEPFDAEVREVELPPPAANQILVAHRGQRHQRRHRAGRLHRHASVAQGPEPARLEVPLPARLQRGRHRRGRRRGHSRLEGRATASAIPATTPRHELLTLGHERGRLWKLPRSSTPRRRRWPASPATAWAPRSGRPHAGPVGRGARPRRHRPVRACGACMAAGAYPGRRHRRGAPCAATRPWPPGPTTSSTPRPATCGEQLAESPRARAAPRSSPTPPAFPTRSVGDVAGLRRRPGGRRRQPARQGEGRELLRRPAPPLHRSDRGARQHAVRAGPHPPGRRLGHQQGAELAAGRRSPRAGSASTGWSRTASRRASSAPPTRGC